MAAAAEEEIPPHLRGGHIIPPDQDCDDMEKIVVTPVYRGRLEESHDQTRRAWRRRSWFVIRCQRLNRDLRAFMDDHSQQIFTALTYITGGIMLLILGILLVQIVLAKSHKSTSFRRIMNPQ